MRTAYLPVFCASCARAQLQPVEPGATPTCLSCGASSVVLPGETYAESDVPLFDRIETAVRALNMTSTVADQIVRELKDPERREHALPSLLLNVVDLLPNLSFLVPALQTPKRPALRPAEMPRAASMLLAIASARLRMPSSSAQRLSRMASRRS